MSASKINLRKICLAPGHPYIIEAERRKNHQPPRRTKWLAKYATLVCHEVVSAENAGDTSASTAETTTLALLHAVSAFEIKIAKEQRMLTQRLKTVFGERTLYHYNQQFPIWKHIRRTKMSKLNNMVLSNLHTRDDILAEVDKLDPSKTDKFRKVYEGKSIRSAIDCKCLSCKDCNTQEIRECDDTACGLHNVRPYQAE
jgi:hypothetical protein